MPNAISKFISEMDTLLGEDAGGDYTPPAFTDEQENVLKLVNEGRNILVTGPAGTGKSLLLTHLRQTIREGLHVVASTGIAAVNVGGVTIHSWSGVGIADDDPVVIAQAVQYGRPEVAERIRAAKTLAVDEVSMLSASLLNVIDLVFKTVRGAHDKPFGGIQMLFFGDFLQLPPVAKNREEQEFAFDAKSWKDSDIQTVFLTKVFRQENVHFQRALEDVRRGERTDLVRRLFNSCYNREDEDKKIEPVILHSHNAQAEAMNLAKLARIEGEPSSYPCSDTGSDKARKLLEKNCIAPDVLTIKPGAQVMLLCNLDVEGGLANGSIGLVDSVQGSDIRVMFPDYGTVQMEPHKWEIKEDRKIIGSRTQIPLRLAYAITIHKSQGLQFPKLRVFLSKCFEYGQAYVALSRAKSHEGLFVDTPSWKPVKAHPRALHFYGIIDDEELARLGFGPKKKEQLGLFD